MPPMEADPRFTFNVEREKLSALYVEWQDEREYVGMVRSAFNCPATPEQTERLARYEARYRAQLQVVAAARACLTPAHLAWYQEQAHYLAAADFTRINPHNEPLIADVEA